MDLELTTDQELLRTTTAKFIGTCPLSAVRELIDSDTGMPSGYLREAAELGWFAMLVPEEHGGGSISGQGLCDLALIAEERGRGLQPGPFASMNVVATALATAEPGDLRATVLPAIAAGGVIATWVTPNTTDEWGQNAAITVTKINDRFTLSGHASPVHEGQSADWLLVTGWGSEGLSQFLVASTTPGITVSPLKGHDVTQRFASVTFVDVEVPMTSLVGKLGEAQDDVEWQLQLALVLTTSETIGALDALFEMTRQYSLDRTAFGRPIGSFQAIKHQFADMSLSLEAGKAIAVAAARASQMRQNDAGEIASMAKSWVSDTGIDIAQGCFQVFGGIGYTWEHDLHLYLRRITMNSLLFGNSDWHRERICRAHDL